MIGIVVVSHSGQIAKGVIDIAAEMATNEVPLIPASGAPDDGIGTSVTNIADALRRADDRTDGIVVLADLGSAVMNTELAIEMTGIDATIANAPLVEGTFSAAVEADTVDATVDSVIAAAEDARNLRKNNDC